MNLMTKYQKRLNNQTQEEIMRGHINRLWKLDMRKDSIALNGPIQEASKRLLKAWNDNDLENFMKVLPELERMYSQCKEENHPAQLRET